MIDLMIPLQGGKTVPYYEQIYLYIREEIRTGRIRRGEKMPSTRQLAAKLGISRSTTQLAYDQLTAEGYLEAKPCCGYYAADIDLPFSMEKEVIIGSWQNFFTRGTLPCASSPRETK